MRPGDVVGGRFEIRRLAGSGGMGDVFHAWDSVKSGFVAIKVLAGHGPGTATEPLEVESDLVAIKVLSGGFVGDRTRFEREAQALARLRHPAIVEYVAHGQTPAGEPYLAMEWLDGEDLAARLRRGRLAVEDAVLLGTRVAEALALAHRRGVVHRDLKPSNLLLVNHHIDSVKVLDFGIAHLPGRTRITGSGACIGTLGYMAPEQAQSGEQVGAMADVFSLGCVLYECLTGTPAFAGEHPLALLAKVIVDEVPRVRESRPEVPEWLDALVAQMLDKDPMRRPRDGRAVVEALGSVAPESVRVATVPPPSSVLLPSLTGGEQRVLSVALMAREGLRVTAETVDASRLGGELDEMRAIAEGRGGRFALLSDGSAVITIWGAGVATDQAVQAARCTLALRARAPGRAIALATGRGEVTGRLPVGEVIDRAARLLVRDEERTEGAAPRRGAAPILIDEVTAGLLSLRFEIAEEKGLRELRGERAWRDEARPLLGKPTACVGRERELATLDATLAECIDEPVARPVLVTAPPGVGKSRLAHELVRKARERRPGLEVWIGRGDPLRTGSSLGMLASALRSVFGLRDDEPIATRWAMLQARVGQHVPAPEQRRVAELLAEILGLRLPDPPSPPLRAARQDAQLMAEQTCRAWEDFLRAECAAHPVLMILEDLHWCDLPTVRFVESALRGAADSPFMVLALARPDVHERFPRLWVDQHLQEIRLPPLTRRMAERLVRQVLGGDIAPGMIDRLLGLAEGNAFYLEELIRTAAEAKGERLPDTVLAMVEVRLEALEPDARRVLRAASVFGEVLWPDGVAALLGGQKRASRVRDTLARLVEQELLVPHAESRFAGEPELAFRHALIREGAYATLTSEDRVLGHRLAATWLEQQGESDPMLLAEHFERGEDPVSAATYYLRAGEQSLRGGDADTVLPRARRALELEVPHGVRVRLLSMLCECHGWRGEWDTAVEYGAQVLALSTIGSSPWMIATNMKLASALRGGAIDEVFQTLDVLQRVEPSPDAVGLFAGALSTGIYLLDATGRCDLATAYLGRFHALVDPVAETDPIVRAWLAMAHTHREAWVNDDPWSGLRWSRLARASFVEVDHQRGALFAQVLLAMNLWLLGSSDEAEAELRGTMRGDQGFGLATSLQRCFLVGLLLERGALDEARREAIRFLELARSQQAPIDHGRARLVLADALRRRGDLEEAEREALEARALLAFAPLDRMAATMTLAAVRLALGRAEDALATAEEGMAEHEALRAFGFRGAFVRLVYAEALLAAGHRDRARAAVATARARLLATAERIGDAEARRRFLERVPENARTLALARELAGEGEAA